MRVIFIHNKRLKVRIAATLLFLPFAGLLVLALPGSPGAPMYSAGWWRNVAMISSLLCIPIWGWRLASQQPDAVLPDPAAWSGPNVIPLRTRILNGLIALALSVYAFCGLWFNHFRIPAKRQWIHLHDHAVWWFALSLVFIVLRLLAVIADHLDKRNNERLYADVGEAFLWFFWVCQLAAMVASFEF
jgi:hypothetical protein